MSARACAICGSTDPPRRWRDVVDYVTGDSFAIVQCHVCGFGVTEPLPGSLDRYYPTRYRRFNALAARVLHGLYLRRVDGWLRRLPPTGLALEVGAGTGWMLRALRERGWRALGNERSLEAALAARAAAGVPIFVGDLGAVRPAPALDLVIMFHVLEHLADPLAELRAVARRLRPGGALVLGLPNIASWQARLAGRHWMHLDVPRHLCHFTPDSIERALAVSGYRMTRIDFRSYEHDPFGWVQSTLDRLGFEHGLLIKQLTGMKRRSGAFTTLAALVLAVPLGVVGLVAALASWRAGAGAVMEVWAVREDAG
ncbi:MAG: class I SAM-dependent methyltransferase [Chloroflexi bacterium]|nr:MAG: class I SAM-dependent methyltransferase [Chloroflexota bacterium]